MKDFFGANLIDSTVNSTIIMDPTKRPDDIIFFCFLFWSYAPIKSLSSEVALRLIAIQTILNRDSNKAYHSYRFVVLYKPLWRYPLVWGSRLATIFLRWSWTGSVSFWLMIETLSYSHILLNKLLILIQSCITFCRLIFSHLIPHSFLLYQKHNRRSAFDRSPYHVKYPPILVRLIFLVIKRSLHQYLALTPPCILLKDAPLMTHALFKAIHILWQIKLFRPEKSVHLLWYCSTSM